MCSPPTACGALRAALVVLALGAGPTACDGFDGNLLGDPIAGFGDENRGTQSPDAAPPPPLSPPPDAASAPLDAAITPPPRAGSSSVPPRDSSVPSPPDGDSGSGGSVVVADAAADAQTDAATDAATPPTDAGTDAGSSCQLASTDDYCDAIPALAQAPIIDGALDCGPPLLTLTPTNWNGASPIPAGHTTKLAVAHRPDGLYVYVEVRGQVALPHPSANPIYCGDAIELYVDGDGVIDATAGAYDVPGTMQIIVAAPASESAPNAHGERYRQGSTQGAWTSTRWQVAWLADGYALEAFLVAADLDLSSWAPSGNVGLDLVIDVSAPASTPDLRCGLQLGQYFMRVSSQRPSSCSGEPWCDARAYCTPSLQ